MGGESPNKAVKLYWRWFDCRIMWPLKLSRLAFDVGFVREACTFTSGDKGGTGVLDLIVGIICVIAGGAFALNTWEIISQAHFLVRGHGIFPLVLSLALTGCGILLFIKGWRSTHQIKLGSTWIYALAIALGAPAVYLLVMNILGFTITTPLFLIVLFRLLAWRSWIMSIVVGLVFGLSAALVFKYWLYISFPSGVFGF